MSAVSRLNSANNLNVQEFLHVGLDNCCRPRNATILPDGTNNFGTRNRPIKNTVDDETPNHFVARTRRNYQILRPSLYSVNRRRQFVSSHSPISMSRVVLFGL